MLTDTLTTVACQLFYSSWRKVQKLNALQTKDVFVSPSAYSICETTGRFWITNSCRVFTPKICGPESLFHTGLKFRTYKKLELTFIGLLKLYYKHITLQHYVLMNPQHNDPI
jgi:hypothetical protein